MSENLQNLTFNAIDFETANSFQGSICQVGIVHVLDGKIVEQWQSLVNPMDDFHQRNIAIHGIQKTDVKDSPTYPQVYEEMRDRLQGEVLISHSHFDRNAMKRANEHYELHEIDVTWLDSLMIARRTWPELRKLGGHNLKNLAEHLNISFQHHDALEDAKTVAEVIVQACEITGSDITEWSRKLPSLTKPKKKTVKLKKSEGFQEGLLYGETILFTGRLQVVRKEAAIIASQAGCNVVNNVTNEVTILVVGNQDLGVLRGHEKSSKHRAIERKIANGADIKIISEEEFFELVNIDVEKQ